MVRRFVLLLTALCGVVLTTAPVAAAQTDVDIPAISETVLATDPAALIGALTTPPNDELLPEGFSNASYVDLSVATPSATDPATLCTAAAESLPDAQGSALHTIEADTAVVGGLLSSGCLSYVVLNEADLSGDPLAGFREQVAAAGTPAVTTEASPESGSTSATVTDIQLSGQDATLVTATASLGGLTAVVQSVGIVVGNVVVLGTVVVFDDEVDTAATQAHAEALTLAGVQHLGAVAESAQ